MSDDDEEDEDEDEIDDELDSWPLPVDELPAPPDAGVVAGGDGVASLSTLFALFKNNKI